MDFMLLLLTHHFHPPISLSFSSIPPSPSIQKKKPIVNPNKSGLLRHTRMLGAHFSMIRCLGKGKSDSLVQCLITLVE